MSVYVVPSLQDSRFFAHPNPGFHAQKTRIPPWATDMTVLQTSKMKRTYFNEEQNHWAGQIGTQTRDRESISVGLYCLPVEAQDIKLPRFCSYIN